MSDVLAVFGDLMMHEFMVIPYLDDDDFGNPTFGAAAGPFRGRVDLITKQRPAFGSSSSSQSGPQEQPDATIICPPLTVHVRDKVQILVPETSPDTYVVYKVDHEFAEISEHHVEISLRLERP